MAYCGKCAFSRHSEAFCCSVFGSLGPWPGEARYSPDQCVSGEIYLLALALELFAHPSLCIFLSACPLCQEGVLMSQHSECASYRHSGAFCCSVFGSPACQGGGVRHSPRIPRAGRNIFVGSGMDAFLSSFALESWSRVECRFTHLPGLTAEASKVRERNRSLVGRMPTRPRPPDMI